MTEDKNRKQVQDQGSIRKIYENAMPGKKLVNASESKPKEGTQPIIRSRDDSNNRS